jgi:hypothetical protein
MALPDIDLSANQKIIVGQAIDCLKRAKAQTAAAKTVLDAAKAARDAAEIEAAARQGVDLTQYKLSEKKGKFVDKTTVET